MSPPANFEGRTYRFDESNAPISNLMTNTPVFGEFLAGGPPFDTVTTSETERFPDQPPSTGHNDLEANDQRFQRTPYLSTEWNCDTCMVGFRQKWNMYRHMNSLHGGVRFSCSFCPPDSIYEVGRKDTLRCHIRKRHPQAHVPPPQRKSDRSSEGQAKAGFIDAKSSAVTEVEQNRGWEEGKLSFMCDLTHLSPIFPIQSTAHHSSPLSSFLF